jgi:hypothetical protein
MILTAAQAREISGPSAEDYLATIEQHIRKAAEAKQREVLIRDEPFAHWLYGSNELAAEPRKAIDALLAAPAPKPSSTPNASPS